MNEERIPMHFRPGLAALLFFCVLLFAGCAARESAPPRPRFPEQPPAVLAKTPELAFSDALRRNKPAISGGWGYTREDAFVFSVPAKQRGKKRNMIPVESRLVGLRNEVEFTETPPAGQRYAVLDYGTVSRTVGERDGRMYVVWRGRVTLVSEREAADMYRRAAALPLARRAKATTGAQSRTVAREYWFDVTETFGRAGGS